MRFKALSDKQSLSLIRNSYLFLQHKITLNINIYNYIVKYNLLILELLIADNLRKKGKEFLNLTTLDRQYH